MTKVLIQIFIESHTSPPKELILDFDGTDDEVHGNQAGGFFSRVLSSSMLFTRIFHGHPLKDFIWSNLRRNDFLSLNVLFFLKKDIKNSTFLLRKIPKVVF